MKDWKYKIKNVGIAGLRAFAILMVILLASDTTFYWYKQTKWFYLFVVFAYLHYQLQVNEEYKITKSIAHISFGISIATIVGISIRNFANFDFVVNNIFLTGVLFYGYYSIYVILLMIFKKIFRFLCDYQNKSIKFFNNKPELKIFVILFACYGLFATLTYPVQMAGDSPDQVMQSLGISHLYAQHPIVHTKLIGACLSIGKIISNSYNLGAYIYVLIQITIMSLAISLSFEFYKRWRIPDVVKMLCFIFYLIIPSFWTFSNFMMKDTIYFSFFILYFFAFVDICINGVERNIVIILIIGSVGMTLFRKNGLYVALLADIFLAIIVTRMSKKLVLGIIISLILVFVSNVYIYKVLDARKGCINEAMSLPFQQTAFYMTLYDEEMPIEEKNAINGVLEYNLVLESYTPGNADNVKTWYVYSSQNHDLVNYFKCYIKQFFKHPKAYIVAAANMFSGWFDPNYRYGAVTIYTDSKPFEELDKYSIHFEYSENVKKMKSLIAYILNGMKEFPATAFLFSAATYIWIFLSIFIISIVHKSKIMSWSCIPNLLNLGICLLAPLTGEMRYAMPIVATVPILIALLFKERTWNHAV